MLVTVFVATALVGGSVFGWYAAHTYHTHRDRRNQKTVLENTPTHLLETELDKRGKVDRSAFR